LSKGSTGYLPNYISRIVSNPPEGGNILISAESTRRRIAANVSYGNLIRKPECLIQKKISSQRLSGIISDCSTDTESWVTVSSSGSTGSRSEDPNNLVISCTLENEYKRHTTAKESPTDQCGLADDNKREFDDVVYYAHLQTRCITSEEADDNAGDYNSNISPEFCDNHCLDGGHETPSGERIIKEEIITEQLCLCSEGSMKTCACLPNGFKSHESNNRSILDSDFCSTSSFRYSKSGSRLDEQSGEISAGMDISSQNVVSAVEEPESVSSCTNNRAPSADCVSLTNLEDFNGTLDNSDVKCHQLSLDNNKELLKNVYSEPIHHATNRVRSSSVLSRDCESERRAKFLLECLESGYFPNGSLPDVTLSAGEVTEAVKIARQLVCILECALDRVLPSSTNNASTESSLEKSSSSFSANTTRRKQRSRSLSPNILRDFERTDSTCCPSKTELRSDREHIISDADNGTSDKKKVNLEFICDVKHHDTRRFCHRDVPALLHVTPDQLQKQRTLLKPVSDRRLHGSIVQVLDVADILKNAILRRREVMNPSDEFICGTNRSVSEWSLDDI
jgi:hypothetical protein